MRRISISVEKPYPNENPIKEREMRKGRNENSSERYRQLRG